MRATDCEHCGLMRTCIPTRGNGTARNPYARYLCGECINEHHCPGLDDDGRALRPDRVTCGNCGRSWCERCDPAPSALCHYCHGRGLSCAPLDDA